MPVISPAEMGLLEISRELQFGESHASFQKARERKCFVDRKRELGRLEETKGSQLFIG